MGIVEGLILVYLALLVVELIHVILYKHSFLCSIVSTSRELRLYVRDNIFDRSIRIVDRLDRILYRGDDRVFLLWTIIFTVVVLLAVIMY